MTIVISTANMTSSKTPPRYISHFTQKGVPSSDGTGRDGDDAGRDDGADGNGDDGTDIVAGGADSDDAAGGGADGEAGGVGAGAGGAGSGGSDTGLGGSGGNSVVKAPTALQALAVLGLTALTFQ